MKKDFKIFKVKNNVVLVKIYRNFIFLLSSNQKLKIMIVLFVLSIKNRVIF